MSGFCAPTILAIIIYAIGACMALVHIVVLPHKVLQVVAFVLFILIAWLICYGLHTLCSYNQVGWAWGVLGIQLLCGLTAALYMFVHSCQLTAPISNMCQLLHEHEHH